MLPLAKRWYGVALRSWWQGVLESVDLGQESFFDSFLAPETGSVMAIDQQRASQATKTYRAAVTGFHAGNVLLARIVGPYRAHFSSFDEVCRRCVAIDLKPDCDTSILLMAEPADPVLELVAGIDSGGTKIEQSDTTQASAQSISVAITRDCDVAVPQYAFKAVSSSRVPQTLIEYLPKVFRQSGIVHGCRFLSSKYARGQSGR